MKTMQFLILVTIVALFAGCATVAPNELVNARAAYQHASAGSGEATRAGGITQGA